MICFMILNFLFQGIKHSIKETEETEEEVQIVSGEAGKGGGVGKAIRGRGHMMQFKLCDQTMIKQHFDITSCQACNYFVLGPKD